MFTWHVAITILGSLGNNDGNAYKKYHLKVNLCCLKLYRTYFILFNLSNVGNFFGVEF